MVILPEGKILNPPGSNLLLEKEEIYGNEGR